MFGTYGELKSEIQDWRARTDSRFTNKIPSFIALAEQRIYYGSADLVETAAVRVRAMEASVTLTPVADGRARSVSLPTDYLSARRVYMATDLTHELAYLKPERFWTDVRVSPGYLNGQPFGWPGIYTIENGKIYLAPFQSGELELLYYQRFPKLVEDTDSNWLLLNAPMTYFDATLAESWRWSRDRKQQQVALESYAGAVAGLNRTESMGRRSGATLAPKPVRTRISDRGWGIGGGGYY